MLYKYQVHPPQPTDVKNTIATATDPGGPIDKYLIGADIRVAPMSLTLAKFLNEEANGALTAAQIVETTSKYQHSLPYVSSTHIFHITLPDVPYTRLFYDSQTGISVNHFIHTSVQHVLSICIF